MATALGIIKDALVELGALESTEVPTQDEQNDGLIRLNRMVSSWNNERLLVYAVSAATYTLDPGVQSPTIGLSGGATFSAVRPVRIENANIINTSVTPNERWPLVLLDRNWWASRYVDRDEEFPRGLYYEPTYPDGTLHLSDIPTVDHDLELFTWTQFPAFASLAAIVNFPPGYEEALMYNLAVRLAPSFGATPSAITTEFSRTSREKLKSINAEPPYMRTAESGLGSGDAGDRSAPTGRVTWRTSW